MVCFLLASLDVPCGHAQQDIDVQYPKPDKPEPKGKN
jgi:hypothetical protein